MVHVDVRVHAAGGVGDDARAGEGVRDQRRHIGVHRPGQLLPSGGAELASRHEHCVRKLRQRLDLLAVKEVGGDALDPAGDEPLAQSLLAETRDGDDALARRGALGKPGQRRTDLAAGAEDNEVAADVAEFLHHAGRGRGHHLLEMLHVAEAFGQCCGTLCHGEINLVRHGRARPGHPRLGRRAKDMDARDKPAHDGDTVAARFSPQTDAVARKR